jgi:trans-2,3-dihydro-3-hydroxyanthranilate isomerase
MLSPAGDPAHLAGLKGPPSIVPKSYRYLQLDVFTDRLFGGNQLAVFLDARGLASSTMQAVAKEMNFSETTFVLPSERADTDVRMRIFTPGAELPIAGHPTIGSTFALARAGVIAPDREHFVFGLGAGPVSVALTWRSDELSFAWMSQPLPTFLPPSITPAEAAAALGLPEGAVSDTGLPVQVVSCGVPFLYVPLTTRSAVDRATIDPAAYARLMSAWPDAGSGVFCFSAERAGDNATVYSRMFAPAVGVFEDAATGIASGPLGCYLVRHNLVTATEAASMLSLQGVKMGRPSQVHISIAVEAGDIRAVRVGGESVLAGEGTLYIP